jgi:hypothetical protein
MDSATDEVGETFTRVSKKFDAYNDILIDALIARLDGNRNNVEALKNVLGFMFDDGTCNWGRVVTAIILARKTNKSQAAGHVVADKVSEWIDVNGGFEKGFVEFFPAPPPPSWVQTYSSELLAVGLITAVVISGFM